MSFNTQTARRRPRYQSTARRSNSGRRGPVKNYIHPSKFVQAAKPKAQDDYVPVHTFEDFAIHKLLKENLARKSFTVPSPIQDQAIPAGLVGNDVVGIANTGTGKTLAFGLPLLNALMEKASSYALVLAPTRELAQQIEQEFRSVAKGSGLTGALLIGGSSMSIQLRDLRTNPRIVVGTPGRVKDHIDRGTLKISQFNIVVLDEVDRMLDMGFINDMREILGQIATNRQSYFFSATLDKKVSALIDTFIHEPVTISVKTGETSENIEQDIIPYQTSRDKIVMLQALLNKPEVQKCLIFDETQRSVESLSKELATLGYRVDAIHGGKNQGQRKRALDKFKRSDVSILVATDVAARGIDVSDITHVINYSQPQAYEDYVHRIGRAGRAGRIGYAFTFVKV